MREFAVGDVVTYGSGRQRLCVEAVWMEKFPAFAEPQQVARIKNSETVVTMRSAHLRLWGEPNDAE